MSFNSKEQIERKCLQFMYLTGHFITRLYRDVSQLNNEKTNSPIWKWTKENKNTPLLKKSGQRIWIESALLQRNTQMASEHEKRCSTSLVSREMQMTTAVRYHFTPTSQLKKKTDTHTHKERQTLQMLLKMKQIRTFLHCWWEMQNGSATLENSLAVP